MGGTWRSFRGDLLKMETAARALRTGSAPACKKRKSSPPSCPTKKQQHNNKNPEEGGMNDVTEPRSQADKGGAPLPLAPRGPTEGRPKRRVAKRETRNFSSLRKKSCALLAVGFFFFLSLLSSFPLPLLPFESFFFFFFPSLTAWLIQLQCQSPFFSSSSSFK